MANFSILEALDILHSSIPSWNTRLDDLNGQIALRQIELARLEQPERRPTSKSLRNKGSTESLRPNDGGENPFGSNDHGDDIPMNPFDTPKSDTPNAFSPLQRTSSSLRRIAATSVPVAKTNSRDSTGAIARQMSTSKSPTHPNGGRNVLRKRKTESLASGESMAPKYRTRSMIIIYYDGEVQNAFEDLVKFVSVSRNNMRKGKMAAKMAEMKRAAELEVEEEEDDELENIKPTNGGTSTAGQKKRLEVDPMAVGLEVNEDNNNIAIPKLKYVSTRQMGPSEIPSNNIRASDNMGSKLSLGLLRGYRRGSGAGDPPDIFEVLDKGLEWCQIQCEAGAHNFLREGECGTEISSIKNKLVEVQAVAGEKIERLKTEEAMNGSLAVKKPMAPSPKPRSRELKSPQLRRDFNAPKELEVDDMEVDDDEGIDDMQIPTQLVFKRSGQM